MYGAREGAAPAGVRRSSAFASLGFPADDADEAAEGSDDAFDEPQLVDAFCVKFSELFGVRIAFGDVGRGGCCW